MEKLGKLKLRNKKGTNNVEAQTVGNLMMKHINNYS
jgi:hypothetical protein